METRIAELEQVIRGLVALCKLQTETIVALVDHYEKLLEAR